jgi:hypothetical protein
LVNTTARARESPAKFGREDASEMRGLPIEFKNLFAKGKAALADTTLPEYAMG